MNKSAKTKMKICFQNYRNLVNKRFTFIVIDNSVSPRLVWNNYGRITSSAYNDHTLINREAPNDTELGGQAAAPVVVGARARQQEGSEWLLWCLRPTDWNLLLGLTTELVNKPTSDMRKSTIPANMDHGHFSKNCLPIIDCKNGLAKVLIQ